MTKLEPVHKPQTLTDWLRANTKFIIDPIVAVLARLGVTPNTLTLLGLLVHVPVAYLLATGRWRLAALVALCGLLDALDGALARKLNIAGSSKFGAFFDSTSDRVAEIVLYGGFIYYYGSQSEPLWTLITLIALGGALMVSYLRARAEGLGIDCKVGLFSRIERYLAFFVFTVFGLPQIALSVLAVGTWITVGQRFHHVWRSTR